MQNRKKSATIARKFKETHMYKNSHIKKLTVSALVVDIVSAWEIAAITLERLFSIVTSVGLCSIL